MIVTITEVTQEFTKTGEEYKKVKGTTADGKETTKSIFNHMKSYWELLVPGAMLDFTMEKRGQFWNVTDIKRVKAQPPQSDAPQPKLEESPNFGQQASRIATQSAVERSEEIARQVWVKEIGEWWRSGAMGKLPEPIARGWQLWYLMHAKMVTGVSMPEKPKPAPAKPVEKPGDKGINPEDIAF